MLGSARRPLHLLSIIGALLMTLAVFAPKADAHVAQSVAVSAAAITESAPAPLDICAADGCLDCGLACAHGCCQAQASAILNTSADLTPVAVTHVAAAWSHVSAAALAGPPRLERPPRA